ncbi:MAG: hypothetical protein U0694_13135 [Anaerolineae bacterium]
MRRLLLRAMGLLLLITMGGSFLALAVGQSMPAEMLTTYLSRRFTGEIDRFLLIDLNRHIRLEIPVPLDMSVGTPTIDSNGQDVYIQTQAPGRRLYHYNLLTRTLNELNTTYLDRESGETYQMRSNFFWSNSTDLWEYNPADRTLYRFNIPDNTVERVVTLPAVESDSPLQPGGITPIPIDSPSGAQIALVNDSRLYLFNSDGTNLRQYFIADDADFGFGNWSPDERYVYISASSLDTAVSYFRALDVSSGEFLAATQDLEGSSFFPCGDMWIAYIAGRYEGHLLNFQTGATRPLSAIRELAGRPINYINWMDNCQWLMVEMRLPSSSFQAPLEHQPIYIVSRDGQTVYPLGEQVAVLQWTDENTFLLAEAQGSEDSVYAVYFDGAPHTTLLGHFTPTGSQVRPLSSDQYRLMMINNNTNQLSIVNLRNGVVETYFAPDEVPRSYPVYWLWR